MQAKLEGRGTGDEVPSTGLRAIGERGIDGAGSCVKPTPSKRSIAEVYDQSSALWGRKTLNGLPPSAFSIEPGQNVLVLKMLVKHEQLLCNHDGTLRGSLSTSPDLRTE